MKKTWKERLQVDKEPVVNVLDKRFADMPAGSRMVVVTPLIVQEAIHNIPKGVGLTVKELRQRLAKTYQADYACPVSTGIFVRIVAEAAHEDLTAGKVLEKVAPFWRVIDLKSNLAKKLSFGTDLLTAQRKKEGLEVG